MVLRDQVTDTDIRLRFKYGKHTIFLFVDPLAPFTDITTELLQVLRERYPEGLYATRDSSAATPIPEDGADNQVSYATPKAASDPSLGWTKLDITGTEKPVELQIVSDAVFAFSFHSPGEEPRFSVEWATVDDLDFD
ncbi:hypothetical protein DL546_005760 [Coniochaeta pulveracea]|uniref:Uncharacterized protein n=1 Tax=Coniochaeta pulveracea TaxID=177199 RepID=A0A420Y769_9PEZI|nr:hypothetical protein DL546_005760 [Coniochaeta pulveracea]